jgi:hypothetical protein
MKKWEINFFDFNENLIESVETFQQTLGDAEKFAVERSKTNKAHSFSPPKELKEMWIKSKVVVFFGINNQFAGMYLVDNQEQVDLITKLVYDFPYYCKVYDDIPRLSESVTFNMDGKKGEVITHITDIDGVVKNVPKNADGMRMTTDDLFGKIEEIFGNQ